ncbi:hypothetical protein B0H65DRAFT_462968 [Neurospora tetraspora]|uniref:Uncharacterized protein n=1 Tax=Neurospora tetraspora TaxID=94610 RepID=A0AAE0MT29_9PEZI|nr:hypothetical protein B0H65DRAFT_462968 [Neurospora tetraspora]
MFGTKGSALRGVSTTTRFCQLPAWSSVCSSSIPDGHGTFRRRSTAAAAAAGAEAENVLPTGSTAPARPAPSLDASTTTSADPFAVLERAAAQGESSRRERVPHACAPAKPAPSVAASTTSADPFAVLWHATRGGLSRRERRLKDGPPVPGIQTPFEKKFTPFSPTKALAMFIRRKARKYPPHKWYVLRALANNKSPRLPGCLAQFMFKQRVAHWRKSRISFYHLRGLPSYLETEQAWARRIKRLERKGYGTSDLEEWSWILQGKTGDEIVQRFVSRDTFKPYFLMNMVLGRDKRIFQAQSLAVIFDYISRHYLEPRQKPEQKRVGPEFRSDVFKIMMYRLMWHCAAVWPAALISVAHLVAAYLETCRADAGGDDEVKWQRIRCRILNSALCALDRRTPIAPYKHVRYNWEAQKVLLAASVKMRPHLLITQNGYRSIRRVLLGMKKTPAEEKAMIRSAKTWPPYRLSWDGVDEQRDREEDLSRSAKAGTMMVENGYPSQPIDEALTNLGGSLPGRQRTIMTRTDGPPKWSSPNMFVYATWVTAIEATRNVREAWTEFQRPPRPNLQPTADVYAAMLEKLFAEEVPPDSPLLPGDSRHYVFPVHDGNLSAYEIARLTPPAPGDLYRQMWERNIRPNDRLLELLLKNTNSIEAGLQYILDGGYNVIARQALVGWSQDVEQINTLPVRVFDAWIKLLCKTHSNYPDPDPHSFSHNHIPLAIKITKLYQQGNARAAHKDKRPWYTILRALATNKYIVREGEGTTHPHLHTLKVFMKAYRLTVFAKGLDTTIFDLLSLMVRKSTVALAFETRKAMATATPTEQYGDLRMVPVIRLAAEKLHATFKEMVRPISVPSNGDASARFELPTLQYTLTAPHIFRYMQALGCLGNAQLMLSLVNWVLDSWSDPRILENAREPGETEYKVLIQTFAYFIEMWPHLPVNDALETMLVRTRQKLEALRQTQGCTWHLPAKRTDGDLKGTDAVVAARWLNTQRYTDTWLNKPSRIVRRVRQGAGAPGDTQNPKKIGMTGFEAEKMDSTAEDK